MTKCSVCTFEIKDDEDKYYAGAWFHKQCYERLKPKSMASDTEQYILI